MKQKNGSRRLAALLMALAVAITVSGSVPVYGASDGTVQEEPLWKEESVSGQEEADTEKPVDEGVPAEVTAEAYGASAQKVAWDTGSAILTSYIPQGKVLKPLLDAFGGLMDSGTTGKEVSDQIQKVSKQVSDLSSDITAFRAEMNTKLTELQSQMQGKLNNGLNKIKNEIFLNGAGSELDALHTQVKELASSIDTIMKDSSLSDKAKAIQIAYLIGDDKDWDETQNALYRFNNLSDLLAGQTYRDTKGRNLYQVFYDNTVPDYMFTGEVYDAMEPYINRVVYEYGYAYTVLAQCLASHLTVSEMTDEEAKALGDDEYNKYIDCKTETSLVKDEFDGINRELLDPKDESSIVSLYSTYQYKKEHDRLVFLNHGKTEIALSDQLDRVSVPWTGTRQRDPNAAGGNLGEYDAKWPGNACYKEYYQNQVDLISGGAHLDASYVKSLHDHANQQGKSLYDLLSAMGVNVQPYKNDAKSWFAVSSTMSSVYTTLRGAICNNTKHDQNDWGFEAIDPKTAQGTSQVKVFLSIQGRGYQYKEYWDRIHFKNSKRYYLKTAKHVFVTFNDISFLGLKKISRLQMPKTAWEVESWGDIYSVSLSTTHQGDFETFEVYYWKDKGSVGKNLFPVTIKDKNGKVVSEDYVLQAREKDGAYIDSSGGSIHFAAGTYHLRARVTSKVGKEFYSDWLEVKVVENDKLAASVTQLATPIMNVGSEGTGLSFCEVGTTYSIAENTVLQSQETALDGILIDNDYEGSGEGGTAEFTRTGTFHIRGKALNSDGSYSYSDWQEITVKDPEQCVCLSFVDTDGSQIYTITARAGEDISNTEEDPEEETEEEASVTAASYGDASEEEEVETEILYHPELTPQEGYVHLGWDLVEENGETDGEAEEVPAVMPEEDAVYVAIWGRSLKDGYQRVESCEELKKAVDEAPAGEFTRIALTEDMTLPKIVFPKAKNARIVIDGMGHSLTLEESAALAPRNGQFLMLEHIELIAADKTGTIKITATAGGLMLDRVTFTGSQAQVNAASASSLMAGYITAENLSIKGGAKTELSVDGVLKAKEITGFRSIAVNHTLTPIKTLKAKTLTLNSDAVLNVEEGAKIKLSTGISGTGTIQFSKGFTPLSLGSANSGCMVLSAEEPLEEDTVLFQSKDKNLSRIFTAKSISPTTSAFSYGLYFRGGKVSLRGYRIRCGAKTYCEWGDCIAELNKARTASPTIELLDNVETSGALKLPYKGKCRSLRINGNGYRLTFTGSKASVGCDTVLRDLTLRSTSGSWTLNKGSYQVTGTDARLIGCTMK